MEKQQINLIRHSMAHILAHAIKNIYGDKAKYGIGPEIENGFYYDIDFSKCESAPTEKDFEKIEKEMDKIIKQNLPFEEKEVSKEEASFKNCRSILERRRNKSPTNKNIWICIQHSRRT